MADVHSIQIKVDASQAKRELGAFNAALGDTAKKLSGLSVRSGGGFDRLAQQVGTLANGFKQLQSVTGLGTIGKDLTSLGKGLSSLRAPSTALTSNLGALAKALNQFQKVSIPRGIGAEMQALGAGLAAIKVPNLAAIQRIPQLIRELNRAGSTKIGTGIAADLATLGNAFQNFKAPSANAGARITALLTSLKGARINPNIAQGLGTLGGAFSNFRAPSSTAAVNIGRLIQVLGTGNVGQVNQMATALQRLSGLAINVGNVQRRVSQGGGQARGQTTGWLSGITTGARSATSSLRGLENAFSATYHVSSLLRTAMGSLTLGAAVKGISDTGNQFLATSRAMQAVAASSSETGEQMQFIDNLTKRLPISLSAAVDGYGKFAVSARSAGTSVKDTETIFEGFATAASGLGLSGEKQKDMFLAVEQIMTKGKFAAQELNQQLANAVPGIKSMLAQSLGVSLKELEQQMAGGGVSADKLVGLAKVMMQVYGSQVPAALRQSAAQMILFGNEFTRIQNTIFSSGFNSGLAAMFDNLTKKLDTPKIQQAAQRIGEAFGEIFIHLGALGSLALDNIEPIAKFAGVLAGMAALSTTVGILKMIASPIWEIGRAAILTTGFLATLAVNIAAFTIAQTFIRGAQAVALLGTAINMAAGQSVLLGVALKGAIYGALFVGAYELGKFIGDTINTVFPNFAAKVQEWKDKLSGDDAADAGKAMGQTVGKNAEQSLWEQIKGFDIAGTLKDGIAAIGNETGVDTSGITKNVDALTDSIRKQQEEWQKAYKAQQDYSQAIKRDQDAAKIPYTQPTGQEEALLKKLKDAHFEAQELARQMKVIDGLSHITEGPYKTSAAEREQMKYLLAYNNLPKTNPYAAEIRSLTDELSILKLTGNAREEEQKFLQIKNALLAKNKVMTGEEEQTVRRMIQAQMELSKGGSNGFQQWANGVKDLKDALADVEKNGVEGLSNALTDLVTKGQADFAALGQSILRSLTKTMIDSILKDAFSNMGGTGLGSLFGFKSANPDKAIAEGKGIVDKAMGQITAATATVNASTVIVNGTSMASMGGLGATPAGTEGALTGMPVPGAPQSMMSGGAPILPTNSFSQPIDASGALDQMKTLQQAGGLGSGVFSGEGMATLGILGGGASLLTGGKTPLGVFGPNATAMPSMPGSASVLSSSGFAGKASLDPIASVMQAANPQQVQAATQKLLEYAPTGSIPKGPALDAINHAIVGKTPYGQNLTTITTPNGLTAKVDAAYADRFQGLIGDLKDRGYHFKKMDGFADRSIRGSTKISEHAKGDAIDLNYYTGKNGEVNALGGRMNDFPTDISQMAKARGLKWGGDWKSRPDPMHFEVDKSWKPNTAMPTAGNMPAQQAMNQAMESSAAKFQASMTPATQQVAQSFEGTMSTATTGMGDALSGKLMSASGGLGSLTNNVTELGSAASSAQGGLGSLISQMMQMGGGGMGGMGGGLDMMGGLFKEGGFVGSPVSTGSMPMSAWHGAPHYAEGTANTSGGIPAILHDNEAVIPLSRGRSVPVEMRGGSDKNIDTPGTVVNNFHFHGVKDADTFKRSKVQLANDMAAMQQRASAAS